MQKPTHRSVQCLYMAPGNIVSIAGRVIHFRKHGGVSFGRIIDHHGEIQFCLRKAENPEKYVDWRGQIKIGDIVYLSGETWSSNTGEKSVLVTKEVKVLQHSMHPFPNKATGILDPEVKIRKRYLDLITDPNSKKRFVTRSKIISETRRLLEDHDFMEIETPILQTNASGALAKPFSTHHNAYDVDMYLRIAPETYLKRAIGASFDKVYEIGKNFRNEGVDSSHLPEFTSLEYYAAYWDYNDNYLFFSNILLPVLLEAAGHNDGIVTFQNTEYDFRNSVVTTFEEIFQKYVGSPTDSFQNNVVDTVFKEKVRPNILQPTYIFDYPSHMSPLAKRSKAGSTVEQWQLLVAGNEIVKCYSELVDPILQRQLLEEQLLERANGDEEAMMLEEDFLEMLEYGCPPCSGLGLGIDRLVAFLTNQTSLRDVVLFPPVL